MPLSNLLNRPCTLLLRSASGSTDAYGNETAAVERVETVCELQPRQQRPGDEPEGHGELSDTRWLLVLPAGTVIDTGDAVEVDGKAYELIGDPWAARNPRTQHESHVEATVRRTAGSEDTE